MLNVFIRLSDVTIRMNVMEFLEFLDTHGVIL